MKELMINQIIAYFASDEYKETKYWNKVGAQVKQIVDAFWPKPLSELIDRVKELKHKPSDEFYDQATDERYNDGIEDAIDLINQYTGITPEQNLTKSELIDKLEGEKWDETVRSYDEDTDGLYNKGIQTAIDLIRQYSRRTKRSK